MTIVSTPLYRPEPAFPKKLFRDQSIFAAMVWAGFTLFMFATTFGVSLFREIEVSGWNIAGQPARWYALVIGIYLGWSALQLYVIHGGTRRAYMIQMLTFVAAYAALLAALFTFSFVLEAGYYAMMGWPQALHEPQLYAHALDLPISFLQWLLIFALWTAGGLFISVAWYRWSLYGALGIPLGLLAISISTYTISGDIGPMNWVDAFLTSRPGVVPTSLVHLAMIAVFFGLSWLAIRDVPIRAKSEG